MTVNSLMKYFLAAVSGVAAILLFSFADQGVLAMAAKYASDKPTLMRFMRDMGYPKIGEWCGEFAASVIARAGGTPPSDAAVASNWRRYGTPDVMPHVGDVAVADRGVPTGETGSHVGFVTGVDLKNGMFTLESGNSRNIYTTRNISCFSFHTPPNNVLSALIGNGVPRETAIGKTVTSLPLSRASMGVYPFVTAISSPNSDGCSQGGLDTDHYDQNGDSLHRVQAPVRCDSLGACRHAGVRMTKGRPCLENNIDGERVRVLHLPPSDADFFATPHACLGNRPCIDHIGTAGVATAKSKQSVGARPRASSDL
jgi:hypothetical protein